MTPADPTDLDHPSLYINRELSWLEFNRRVLEEARDPTVPLLERLKFLAIFSSNLDEFFMVRVGGLHQKVRAGIVHGSGGDRTPPDEQLRRISEITHELVGEQSRCLNEEVLPALAKKGIVIRDARDLTPAEVKHLQSHFHSKIFPVLTPLATDPAHPFPHLHNKSLNVALMMSRPGVADPQFAVVQVAGVLQRMVPLPATDGGTAAFVPLESAIRSHLPLLFPGLGVESAAAFRVTRDSDFELEDDVEDLLRAIEENVKQRRRGEAVRLEIEADAPAEVVEFLREVLDLAPADVYRVPAMLDLTGLFQIHGLPGFAELKDPPYTPALVKEFTQATSPWAAIRAKDILLHHPYESFKHVVDFIDAAADDEKVVAIKQTLYRTSSDSAIVQALLRAADRGKSVTAVVELKARLDEERNIQWAKELEKAGVHVVFGFVGLKTHCKVSLVVRRENENLRRYVHLATGNYNPQTARQYTDVGLFTCNPVVADDATLLFNHLTGNSATPQFRKLVIAPARLQPFMIEMIDREAAHQKAGKRAKIVAKLNGLLEPAIVKALYRASQAGVPIDIVCRGICALRPGIPGVSETVRVISVVDRFLEHPRIFYFDNDGNPDVYVGSADWMDRNLSRRVEVVFPIEQPDLKARVVDEILAISVADTVKARQLQPDGTYRRVVSEPGRPPVRSQTRFLELVAEAERRQSAVATSPAAAHQPSKKPRGKKPG